LTINSLLEYSPYALKGLTYLACTIAHLSQFLTNKHHEISISLNRRDEMVKKTRVPVVEVEEAWENCTCQWEAAGV
jgi:hypothetical protein